MDNGGLRDLLFQVISSWQVIAVTVLILLYISLVNYVSRKRYRKRSPLPPKPKKIKGPPAENVGDDSALGLED